MEQYFEDYLMNLKIGILGKFQHKPPAGWCLSHRVCDISIQLHASSPSPTTALLNEN